MEVQLRTKIMDDIAEIGPAIILDMRKNRKVKEPEEMQFQKENAFILMKLMREE